MELTGQKRVLLIVGVTAVLICIFGAVGISITRAKLFPPKFRAAVNYYALEYDLDPLLVAAVAFVESKFEPEAVSSKNAAGLMQLMPGTAVETAEKLGMEDFTLQQLSDTRINIDLGSCYLRMMIDLHEGDIVLGLAAYNAGPENVKKWLKQAKERGIIEPKEIIANFGFEETVRYVDNVVGVWKLNSFLF